MAQTRRCDISGDPDAASCHLSRFAGDDWEVLGPVCRLFYASKWITGWLRSPSRSGKRPGCCARGGEKSRQKHFRRRDRKSTRLNSSHLGISYAVFCLKKKKKS